MTLAKIFGVQVAQILECDLMEEENKLKAIKTCYRILDFSQEEIGLFKKNYSNYNGTIK